MILEKEYSWRMCSFPPHKVEQIYCAFNETFVVYLKHCFRDLNLLHVDKDGHVLRQYQLKDEFFLTMISDHEILTGEYTKIRLIDLRNKNKDKTITIPIENTQFQSSHESNSPTSFERYGFFFEETKLLCVVNKWQKCFRKLKGQEHYSFQTQISASYIPLASIYSKTTKNTIVQKMEVNEDRSLEKVDNSSSISAISAFWKTKKSTKFEIISLDKIQKFSCPSQTPHAVQKLWRKNENEFFLTFSLMDSGLFIANLAHQSIIQEPLFPKEGILDKIIFFEKFFICIRKYKNVFVEIFNYEMKEMHYFHVEKDQMHSTLPQDGTMTSWVGRGWYELWVKRTKFFSMEDAYMQMLLHENEDFDDDLLLDVMNELGFD